MRQILCSLDELQSQIKERCPKWKQWSDIKPIFLELQNHKCAFCESNIDGRLDPRTGTRQLHGQDVEHFRPKARVECWQVPGAWLNAPLLKVGPLNGYSWLTYDFRNYLATCKSCNSGRKRNYFPVASPLADYDGQPGVFELAAESPYLVYPLSFLGDTEPETLIAFLGADCVPHPDLEPGTHNYWRASITIEIVGLNRIDLMVRRSQIILSLALIWCTSAGADVRHRGDHLSCGEAYLKLCRDSPNLAQQIALNIARETVDLTADEREILQNWPGSALS